MYLLKFETDYGRLYLVSPKPMVRDINLSLSKPVDSVSFEAIKNYINNIEAKFKEEPVPKEEIEKEKEDVKEKDSKKKKATYAEILRQYAGVIQQYASILKD
jgi:methionyl-tRNA synthetase